MYGDESVETDGDKLEPKTIHEMVISHSQFLPTMLQESASPLKDRLVELLWILVQLEPQSCQPGHLAVLLGAYAATLSQTGKFHLLWKQGYKINL